MHGIAAVAAFLVSARASFVTGTVQVVDGGRALPLVTTALVLLLGLAEANHRLVELPLRDDAAVDLVTRLLADCDGLPFAVEEILAAAISSGERSWMASRRKPKTAPGSLHTPAPSGPRCRRRSVITLTVSTLAREPMIPAIPHMSSV